LCKKRKCFTIGKAWMISLTLSIVDFKDVQYARQELVSLRTQVTYCHPFVYCSFLSSMCNFQNEMQKEANMSEKERNEKDKKK